MLGEPYRQQVWVFENNGESVYDALNLQLEKRYANNWSARASYSLSYSRGTSTFQNEKNTDQFLTNPNLDKRQGPTAVDRRHILSISGRTEIPKTRGATLATTVRYMSGAPFTIWDSSIDADQNGELDDPLPAGTYSGTAADALQNVKNKGGRNGAYGPDYFQVDLRAGWRFPVARGALEMFLDMYNITNRANYNNPTNATVQDRDGADRRLTDSFLRLTTLYGGSGFPRQAQFGLSTPFSTADLTRRGGAFAPPAQGSSGFRRGRASAVRYIANWSHGVANRVARCHTQGATSGGQAVTSCSRASWKCCSSKR